MMKILLTQGKVALVDDGDFKWLDRLSWQACKPRGGARTWYAKTTENHYGQHQVLMHRMILGLKPGDGVHTDHWDGNGLNNQRANLRQGSRSQNMRNTWKHRERLKNAQIGRQKS